MCINKLTENEEKIETIEDLKELINYHLFLASSIREFAKANNVLNEQFYLDWEDELNRYSTLDPND